MGMVIGAIASGQVPLGGADRTASRTGGFRLLTGALFTGTCAWLAAAYLTAARNSRPPEMVTYFSGQACAAGVGTGLIVAGMLAGLNFAAPRAFTRPATGAGLRSSRPAGV